MVYFIGAAVKSSESLDDEAEGDEQGALLSNDAERTGNSPMTSAESIGTNIAIGQVVFLGRTDPCYRTTVRKGSLVRCFEKELLVRVLLSRMVIERVLYLHSIYGRQGCPQPWQQPMKRFPTTRQPVTAPRYLPRAPQGRDPKCPTTMMT